MPYERRDFDPEYTSYSELDTLATCEQRWWLRFPKGGDFKPTPAMQKGTMFHEMIGPWWETGELPDPVETYEANELDMNEQFYDDTLWLVDRYVRVNADFRKKVKVVGTELELVQEFPYFPVKVVSHVDQLWELDGKLIAVERKTMRGWRRLDLIEYTTQESLYIWQLRAAGYDIDALVFDAANTYRWVPDKPTQQDMIDSVTESAMGPPWGPRVGEPDPEKPGKTLTLAAAKREWARAAVAAHPGIDRPDEDSFQRHWLDRTDEQIEQALRWAQTTMQRRSDLLQLAEHGSAYTPIRNIGPSCNGCSVQEDCFAGLSFAMEIELDLEDDE